MNSSGKTAIVSPFLLAAFLTVESLTSVASAEFTPVAGWDRHLFPSYIIATATMKAELDERTNAKRTTTLGDPRGLLGVSIVAPEDGAVVKVTIACDSILKPSTISAALTKKGERYRVCPSIKYDFGALARNRQTVPVAATFRVELAGKEPEEQTVALTLRSINDCPMSHGKGKDEIDVCETFAAYVNEEHPQIEKILQEALAQGVVDSFQGYSDDGPEDVLRQAYAIWHVLCKRGMRYSNVTTTVGDSESVDSQHVRFVEESIGNVQANCVDGSVLFASLLRKIGIEPFLVVEPEHCYVGFYLDEEGKQPVALETTMLGDKPDEDDDRTIEGFDEIVEPKWVKTDSWASFASAVETGTDAFAKNADKFKNKKQFDYQLISIAEARRKGILPIPFTKD